MSRTISLQRDTVTRIGVALIAALSLLMVFLVAQSSRAQAGPATWEVSAKAKSLSAKKVKTTVKITLRTKKTTERRTIKVKLNPYGSVTKSGRTEVKSVRAKWSKKKRGYTAKVSFKSKRTGVVKVSSPKAGSKKIRTPNVKTTLAQWDTVQSSNGSVFSDVITVTPAYGRSVTLQQYLAKSWKTVKKFKLANQNTANLNITHSDVAMHSGDKFRVVISAGAGAKKEISPTKQIVSQVTVPNVVGRTKAQAKSMLESLGLTASFSTANSSTVTSGRVVSTAPLAGHAVDYGSTVRVVVSSGASSSTPGNPTPGQRVRNCWDYGGVPFDDCNNQASYSNVYDVLTKDNRCGDTIECIRLDPARGETQWNVIPDGVTTEPWNTVRTETLYLPGMIDALNKYAVDEGWVDAAHNAAHPTFRPLYNSTGFGFKSTANVTLAGENSLTSVDSLGQGGYAQMWAETRAAGHSSLTYKEQRLTQNQHSCKHGGNNNCTPSVANNPKTYLQAYAPVVGYTWTCSEQRWETSNMDSGTIYDALKSGFESEPSYIPGESMGEHYRQLRGGVAGALLVDAPIYVNYGSVRWDDSYGTIYYNGCMLYKIEGGQVTYGTIPGDTY